MKLLYIANARIPTEKAHGLQIVKMCEAFAMAGAEVELILPNRRNVQFKARNLFDYYKIKNNFSIKKLPAYDPIWLLKFPAGIYFKIQTFIFSLSLLTYLILKKNKKNYIFYTRDEFLLALLQLFSDRIVWEAHYLPNMKYFYLRYWQCCHKIISITQGLKDELVKLGINDKNILVSPDGVDLAEFDKIDFSQDELRRKLNLPVKNRIIMYTGHLYDWKGAETLAEAAKQFSADELFVFIGGTKKEIFNFRNRFGNISNILILDFVVHDKIPYYLKLADILILPNSAKKNISKYFTSPMKLFEYMAARRPIVASDLPSIREILDQNCAILVKPDSAADLAEGIKKLLNDKLLSTKITNIAYNRVKKYNWLKRANNILTYINN